MIKYYHYYNILTSRGHFWWTIKTLIMCYIWDTTLAGHKLATPLDNIVNSSFSVLHTSWKYNIFIIIIRNCYNFMSRTFRHMFYAESKVRKDISKGQVEYKMNRSQIINQYWLEFAVDQSKICPNLNLCSIPSIYPIMVTLIWNTKPITATNEDHMPHKFWNLFWIYC